MVKRSLALSRVAIFNGKVSVNVLEAVLLDDCDDQYKIVLLSDRELHSLSPAYTLSRRLRGLYAFNAVVVLDTVTGNTCFCATTLQLVSELLMRSYDYTIISPLLIFISINIGINSGRTLSSGKRPDRIGLSCLEKDDFSRHLRIIEHRKCIQGD